MAARILIEAVNCARGGGAALCRADGVGLNTENKAPDQTRSATCGQGEAGQRGAGGSPAETGSTPSSVDGPPPTSNMDAAEYKPSCWGKYVSDTFQARRKELERQSDDYYLDDADDEFLAEELERDYYREDAR